MAKDLKITKPVVVFDFDNTLFDSTELKRILFGKLASVNGFSETDARAFYAAARNDEDGVIAITLDRFLNELRKRCRALDKNYDEIASEKVVENIKKYGKKLLLPGARQLLNFCQKKNFSYFLLSLGVHHWQLEKMRWVGIDKIFNNKNTVFTVKEHGGKVDALRELFGKNFDGQNTVLFNDRVDESGVLLEMFPKLTVFLRYDKRDHRTSDHGLDTLKIKYGKRVFQDGSLLKLFKIFKNYAL